MNTNPRLAIPALFLLLSMLPACGGDDGDDSNGGGSYAGKTYLLSIGPSNWVSRIGAELQSVPAFIMKVEGSASSYDVTIGTASLVDNDDPAAPDEYEQELCSPTTTVSASSDPYPNFDLGPTDLPLYARHTEQPIAVETKVYDFTLHNVLPDAEPAGEGKLTAMMDAREVYPLFVSLGAERDADRACDFVAMESWGMCEACPTDGQPYCLLLEAWYLEADVTDLQLQPVASVPASCLDLE